MKPLGASCLTVERNYPLPSLKQVEIALRMVDALNRSEYVAALCHRRNGWLVDFDSTRFFATNEAEAKQQATRWADSVVAAVGGMREGTWLQVLLDGKEIYSDVYEAPESPGRTAYAPQAP